VLAPVLAFFAVLVGLAASALSWRALLIELGEQLPWRSAMRVFFVGQLGKYVPGGVWPVLAQMDLGNTAGARPRRVGATAVVVMGINVTTGLLVALACLPFVSSHALHRSGWVLVLLPVGLALLYPRLLGRVVDRLLRFAGKEGLDRPLRWRGVLVATFWSLVMWACYGVQIALLAHPLASSGHRLPLLSTGAYALAWVVGFVVVVAPAGAGAREGMLVLALAPALTASAATAVALVSRLVMTAADFGWAAMAGAVGRKRIPSDLSETAPSRTL
jgi:uncharacterized membrane protein YbhN (UPF0104 family)